MIPFDEVQRLLPQKFPLLMVDRVLSLERGRHALAIKNVTGNELMFLGHFPGLAIMPGVMIIEGMAQTASLLLLAGQDQGTPLAESEQQVFLLGSVEVRFFKPAVPGDTIQYEVTLVRQVGSAVVVDAVARVDGQRIAKAELGFMSKAAEALRKS